MATSNSNAVSVQVERRNIPTYPALAADPNPMFFETRNIQGSNGNIYPHPFTDQLSSEKVDRDYDVITLENEYIEVSLLPEIGGRIFSARDKTNGYDFFYRHEVIKPALIGLFGPWISGGVEFNWPQHHRPGTFNPTSWAIEHEPDGAVTVWMGEHDALNRTKGMVGVRVAPGKALVETRVRLFNRTDLPQSFLWWENAGVHIHEKYQVIFPPDVHYSVYHSKNPVFHYPMAKGKAFGNDYGDGTDVSWWINNPGAVSFFAAPSRYEFFGGYDHIADAGVIHYADAAISPGKKYFAWGNGEFGHAWQKNLMDDTGEYLELMAGVYTDNQPDFTWIMPGETKVFSQYWYPVQKTGAVKNANLRAAVNLDLTAGVARAAVSAVEPIEGARLVLTRNGELVEEQRVDLAPGMPWNRDITVPEGSEAHELKLELFDAAGQLVIDFQPEEPAPVELPEPFAASRKPEDIPTVEELFLEGLHLEQYRHPVIEPRLYWEEALRRDPGDVRSHLALGKLAYRRAHFTTAEAHLRAAVKRLTARNQNPYEGEAHYILGLVLREMDSPTEARDAFNKASWTYAWKSAAYYALALLDCREEKFARALHHLNLALDSNASQVNALALKAAVLRRLGRSGEAAALAATTLALDPLAQWPAAEADLGADDGSAKRLTDILRGDVQNALDLAFDYIGAGMWTEAGEVLFQFANHPQPYPMTAYTLAWLADRQGEAEQVERWLDIATQAPLDYCFPWRLGELRVLEFALLKRPYDARAAYYLGNLLYDKRHYQEGITLWRKAVSLDPKLSIAWRNMGLAKYNLEKDIDGALELYRRSLLANPDDPRTLLEQDGLLRRASRSAEERLAILESHQAVVDRRDDLTIQRLALMNSLGKHAEALEIMKARSFHAWEGGEGSVTSQYSNAYMALGRDALAKGETEEALELFKQGAEYPANLGEHPGFFALVPLIFYRGLAEKALGRNADAYASFSRISERAAGNGLGGVYAAMALAEMGQGEEARRRLLEILENAKAEAKKKTGEDFFYSGHPSPLFEEDPQGLRKLQFQVVQGLAQLALDAKALARRTFRQVLESDPANGIAAEELRRLG